jgi:hypothetical protein
LHPLRILGQALADVPGAYCQGEDAGESVVGHDAVGEMLHGDATQRHPFAGLPDHRVAADAGG